MAVSTRRSAVVDEVQRLVFGPGGLSVQPTTDVLDLLPAELVRSNGESVFRAPAGAVYVRSGRGGGDPAGRLARNCPLQRPGAGLESANHSP